MISSPPQRNLFTVAILGRPNVGKSTLFNCLVGRRRSITDPTPGVTRDAVEAQCQFGDVSIRLIDTGGYTQGAEQMERIVSDRSLEAAQDADLLLLLVDVQTLSGEDQEFLQQLRRYIQKLILVVNKVDTDKQESAVAGFYELGVQNLISVSSAHNRNIDALKELINEAARRQRKDESMDPETDPAIRLAIMGKPNTGKSTLLNRILNEEKAIVSDIPGTTRDTVVGRFSYKQIQLEIIDTAGIRRKGKITENVEYYSVNRAIKAIDSADIVYLVVDSSTGLTEQDKKIAAQVVKRGRGIIIVFNKWDLLPGLPNQEQAISDRVRFLFPILDFAPFQPLSALSGEGLTGLLNTTLKIWNQLNNRIDTAKLNQKLKIWLEKYPIPVRGKNVKIRYATQTQINPVRFVFFVNRLRGFPRRYIRYLKNRLREDFEFDKIPLFVEVKES